MNGKKNKVKFLLLVILLISATMISCLLALGLGAMKIAASDCYRIICYQLLGIETEGVKDLLNGPLFHIVWTIRFPRVLLGLVVGMGLSLCGVVMQATVQNPLAEPYVLGISAGASFGASVAIIGGSILASKGLPLQSVSTMAFIGALGATAVVLLLSATGGNNNSSKLVLSGAIVNALCTALSNFLISIAGDAQGVMSIKFWTMGSITRASWHNILIPGAVTLFCFLFFLTQYRILNTILIGKEAAMTLGLSLGKYRRIYLTVVAVLTGVLVSCCGVIGFIGLIIPHISRSITGSDHRRLLPVSVLLGGIFTVWADVIARIAVTNSEIGIGVITSLVGAPFFAYILIRKNYRFG